MEKFKTGIIGFGNIANGKHMPTLAKMKDVEMVAFCDIIPERAQEAAQKYGVPGARVYTDYRELLSEEEITDVRVLVDNGMHCQITIDALEAGKHVLCEKPLAITWADAKKMVETADRVGKLLTVGYQHRYNPDSIYLKKEIENDALGDIYIAKARVLRRRGAPTWGIFTQKEKVGGGPMIDVATHVIDLVLWLLDNYKPKYVAAMTYQKLKDQKGLANPWGDPDPAKFTCEDSGVAMLMMENGASVIIEASWLLNTLETNGVRYLMCGDKAGADNFAGKLRINGVTNNTQYVLEPDFNAAGVSFFDANKEDSPYREARTFINAMRGEGELCVKAWQAAKVVHVLEGIYTSAETGKPYYFED